VSRRPIKLGLDLRELGLGRVEPILRAGEGRDDPERRRNEGHAEEGSERGPTSDRGTPLTIWAAARRALDAIKGAGERANGSP
jgi:hypothetical protein